MRKKTFKFLEFFNKFLISISFFLIFYSLYKSGLIREENTNPKFVIYSLVFFVIFILLIALNFTNENFKSNCLTFIFSIILSIYFLEILSTFIFKNRFSYSSHNEIKKKYYKKMNKIEPIYSSFEKRQQLYTQGKLDKGTEVMHVIRSKDVENKNIFPLAGISEKKTIFCNEKDEFVFYKSDRYGFNNNDKLWDSEVEIILMGDSFGHGACVNTSKNIAGQLNENNISTLNVSYSGNGPLKTLGSLTEYGIKKNGANYIWLYFEGNDLLELSREIEDKFLKNYLNEKYSQDLINKQSQINKLHNNLISNKIKKKIEIEKKKNHLSKIIAFLKFYNLRMSLNINNPFTTNQNTLNLLEQTFRRAHERVEKTGSKITFVYLPMYLRYDHTLLPKSNLQNKKEVIEIITRNKFNLIDLDKIYFSKLDDPLEAFPLRLNGHYTEKVYKDIALIIKGFVQNEK